jgi:uncharacterized protein (DUF362 family)/NAD-dependent dihydropyrimidine dehydrogenase PreA subunit
MSIPVILSPCTDYGAVEPALAAVLAPLEQRLPPWRAGLRVLLKPNLITDGRPEEAKTTHPEVIRALIRYLRRRGAEVRVGDSPANVCDLAQVWEKTGIAAVCAEERVELVNFEKAGSQPFTVRGFSFNIARPVLESEMIVSVPKVKTHVLTLLTGAVKNMYGCVPGLQKTALHKAYPHPTDFHALLAAIYSCVPPTLAVADGIIGMDGDGPTAGRPRSLGFLAASCDAAALDATLARRLGLNLPAIGYLREIQAQNRGETRADHIEVIHTGPIPELSPPFQAPQTIPLGRLPRWITQSVAPFIWNRPIFSDRCKFCGLCVRACPNGALTQVSRQFPVLAPKRCIACCCCHEVCPERAIAMQASPFLRFVMLIKRMTHA